MSRKQSTSVPHLINDGTDILPMLAPRLTIPSASLDEICRTIPLWWKPLHTTCLYIQLWINPSSMGPLDCGKHTHPGESPTLSHQVCTEPVSKPLKCDRHVDWVGMDLPGGVQKTSETVDALHDQKWDCGHWQYPIHHPPYPSNKEVSCPGIYHPTIIHILPQVLLLPKNRHRLECSHWQHILSTVTGSLQVKAVTDIQDSLSTNSHCKTAPWADATRASRSLYHTMHMYLHLYIDYTTTIACTPHSLT